MKENRLYCSKESITLNPWIPPVHDQRHAGGIAAKSEGGCGGDWGGGNCQSL